MSEITWPSEREEYPHPDIKLQSLKTDLKWQKKPVAISVHKD